MIRAENIYKSFEDNEVLKGISTEFFPGKTNLIIGRSGAGKTVLLKLLIDRKNEVVSRQQILQSVWGYDVYPSTRTIDNFILSFRKYFEEDPRNPKFFQSIRGVGYKFVD